MAGLNTEFENDVCGTCTHLRKEHMQIPGDTHCLVCINKLKAEDHCPEFKLTQRSLKPKLKKPRPNLTLIKGDKK